MGSLSAKERLLRECASANDIVERGFSETGFNPDLQSGETDVHIALMQQESDMAVRAALALQRLENGKEHECAGCNKKIPKARREALPGVLYCIACAQDSERGRVFEVMPDFDMKEEIMTTDEESLRHEDDCEDGELIEGLSMKKEKKPGKGKAKTSTSR